jgi:hypothetical protein
MVRKSVSTIFGLCCAVLVLANSPTVKADGHESDEAKLPEVFKLSNRGEGMSDELVFKLQTVTAVNRLQAAAQTDEELNALKYEDTMTALEAVGVKWRGETTVQISRDEEANEDVVTISRPSGKAVLRYDDEGKQITSEEAGEMDTRGATQEDFDRAVECCWGVGYIRYCSPFGACADGETYCKEWHRQVFTNAGLPGGSMQCNASY